MSLTGIRRETHRPSMKKSAGFTLIEILAVSAVIAVVATLVVANFNTGGPGKTLNKSVEKFTTYCDHVLELALINGETYGLTLVPASWQNNPQEAGWRYSFQRMTQDGWTEIDSLNEQQFPAAIDLIVTLDDIEWDYEDAPKIVEPMVTFYPTGEVDDFSIEFKHRDLHDDDFLQHVIIDEWGEIVWQESAERMAEIEERFN